MIFLLGSLTSSYFFQSSRNGLYASSPIKRHSLLWVKILFKSAPRVRRWRRTYTEATWRGISLFSSFSSWGTLIPHFLANPMEWRCVTLSLLIFFDQFTASLCFKRILVEFRGSSSTKHSVEVNFAIFQHSKPFPYSQLVYDAISANVTNVPRCKTAFCLRWKVKNNRCWKWWFLSLRILYFLISSKMKKKNPTKVIIQKKLQRRNSDFSTPKSFFAISNSDVFQY